MVITKTYITMIITMKRLLTCGMNIKVWKTIIIKGHDYYKNII